MAESTGHDLSPGLRAFVDEAPTARGTHVDFLRASLSGLAPGARILDVGAGDAPYRELFDGFDYVTSDWDGTSHVPDAPYDIVGQAYDLPVADASFDVVVCTQVLEHLPEPWLAVEEFRRILVPGGRVVITAPLTWYLHELPHDYYRFTSYGLGHLLARAGFVDVDIQPMNDSASTIGELLRHLRWILGTADDGRQAHREAVGSVIASLSAVLDNIGWLDTQWHLPISFSAIGHAPGPEPTDGLGAEG